MAKEFPKDCPKKGERWDNLHGGGTCRVMCDPIEGYVMARYKGAGPWLLHVNDWHKKFRRQGEKPPNALAQADAACGVSPGAMGSAACPPERN